MKCWYCNSNAIENNGTVRLTKSGYLKVLAGEGRFFYLRRCPICKEKFHHKLR